MNIDNEQPTAGSPDEMNRPAGSHHGPPDLLNRDIKLLEDFTHWVRTVSKADPRRKDWLPGEVDWLKSRLFWRIRSGKDPLKYPPPTCYSCPWYEVIEQPDEQHTTFEEIRTHDDGGKVAYVAQCRYVVIREGTLDGEANAAIVGFGPYRFRVWNADKEYVTVGQGGRRGKLTRYTGFIQYVETVEAATA